MCRAVDPLRVLFPHIQNDRVRSCGIRAENLCAARYDSTIAAANRKVEPHCEVETVSG